MNLENHPIVDLLKRRYGKVLFTGSGWVRIACPTCLKKNQRKFKRYIDPKSLYNKCFICDVFLSDQHLLGTDDIPKVDSSVYFEDTPKKENPWAKKMPGSDFLPINSLPADHPAVQFLAKDHLTDLDTYYNRYGIVYCPSGSGVMFNRKPFITSDERLIFPVHFKGEFVGWQMRSLPGTAYGDMPGGVKYYHLFNKGQYLYNYDRAKQYSAVVLVEGVKKALKLPNAVASFGKNLTSIQVQLLSEWDTVVVCLDAGETEQVVGNSICKALIAYGVRAINVNLSEYGVPSPDEIPSDQFLNIISTEWKKVLNGG